MSELKDLEKGIISWETSPIDMCGFGGLSSLLSAPLSTPSVPGGERRSGLDRRVADRRVRAREFSVPE